MKDLGRRNRNTLGFFPVGAFDEYASKGSLLVALNKDGDLCGYILYRVANRGGAWPIAIIVHLCIDSTHRRKGIARKLLGEVRRITESQYLRLELKCRHDYEENIIWPKLGFIYKGEVTGKKGLPLDRWEMELRRLPLLALIEHEVNDQKIKAVIDANVFYRLQDPIPTENVHENILSEEAKALEENWLSDDVSLFITDETYNEIQRNDDPAERERRLRYANSFDSISSDFKKIQSIEQQMEVHFSRAYKDSLRSDIRQIAYTIAADFSFFITQDSRLIKKSDDIHSDFGLKIVSPGGFIGRLDEVIRETEYRPAQLAGTRSLTTSRVCSEDIDSLYPLFRHENPAERKGEFERKLRYYFSQPQSFKVEITSQGKSEPHSIVAYDRSQSAMIGIPMIRISKASLSSTVLRYILNKIVVASASEKRPFIQISDSTIRSDVRKGLEESGFSLIEGSWCKFSSHALCMYYDICDHLIESKNHVAQASLLLDGLISALSNAIDRKDPLLFADLERRLWPAKILDANIPNYIVPIRTQWAQNLFDEGLAEKTLWGADKDLILRSENIYYRSNHSFGEICGPARILWYVSYDSKYPEASMQIRACSALDEVIMGRPKDIFRRFQRLGVYEWSDVLRTAGNKLENNIMALRFSNTELLKKPVGLPEIQQILSRGEGKKLVVQSPQRINQKSFARIYQAGNNLLDKLDAK